MSTSFLVNWLLHALSSFNTLLPLWLGLTVLLNAERRAWGVWLAGGSLVVTGVFFIFHSALLHGTLMRVLPAIGIWWYVGWAPIIFLPFAWYLAMLWFAGFWEKERGREALGLPRSKEVMFNAEVLGRHRYWMPLVAGLGSLVLLLVFMAERGPVYSSSSTVDLTTSISAANYPHLVVVYPAYLLCCFLFSLLALRRLAPSGRVMGDMARLRARPWLVATSLVQIVVSMLVGWALLWLVGTRGEPLSLFSLVFTLNRFDLFISLLIAVSMYLLGRAIISYEIFTGKTLPRQGFRRYWRNALILAIGSGALLSLLLTLRLPAVYILSTATVLVATFYSLLTWRSFSERDRYLERLRPFIGSQRLYEGLLADLGREEREGVTSGPFEALSTDVLGARLAYLVPLGDMAPLVGGPLSYPRRSALNLERQAELTQLGGSPETLCLPLDPSRFDGAVWVIPLWSERGLIGALLVGEKVDGGLYTQEEMEVARASGERLLDMQASAEMARRLMAIQRQRLAETQIVDARTRRVLHDDVLPQLHALVLELSAAGKDQETIGQITDIHREISDLLRTMPAPVVQAVERSGVMGALRSSINGEFRGAFDRVEWEIDPVAEERAAAVSPLAAEVLYYAAREALRNAAKYARRDRHRDPLRLVIALRYDKGLILTVEDNGPGIDLGRPSEGGSGQGMALHGTMMAVVGGTMSVESVREEYTRITLTLPEREHAG